MNGAWTSGPLFVLSLPQCSPSSWAKGSQPGLSLTLCFSLGFGGPSILLGHDISKSPLAPQLGMKFKEQEWPGPSPWPPLQFQMLQDEPAPVPCHGLGSASPGGHGCWWIVGETPPASMSREGEG